MPRFFPFSALLVLTAVGAPSVSLASQEPDTVVAEEPVIELDPILVQVLGSPIGLGSPFAVAVAAGDELTGANAGAHLEEAIRAVPGVQIQNRFNMAVGERLSVRGHGPRAQFGVRGVRVLVDGIPATLPDGQSTLDHLDLGGLVRVEALRGPAASVYGNAAGGVLHLSTLDDGSDTGPLTRVRAAAGSHGLLSLRGEAGDASGGTIYRMAYSHLEYDGYRTNPVAKDGGVYGGGRRSVVNAVWSAPFRGGVVKATANGVDLSALNPGSLSQTLLDEGDRQAYRFNVVSKTGKDVRQGQGGVSWNGPLASTDAEFAAWGIWRDVDNPIPGRVIDLTRAAGGLRGLTTSRHETGGGTVTLGGGVEYHLMADDRKNYGNDGGTRTELRLDQAENVQAASVFGQLRFDGPGGVFSALAGLRYDRISFSAEDRFTADGFDDSGSRAMDALSPSVGLVARAGGLELFASAARSFETPTTSELANRVDGAGGINPDLGPQRGFTVEGGFRGDARGGAIFEAVVFRSNLTDELVPFEVASAPGRTFYRNAGSSSHSGVELSLRALLGDVGSVRVAYTMVSARFDEYAPEGNDYSGNRVPGLAPDRLDAVVSTGSGPVFGELRALYQGKVPVDDAGEHSSPAFLTADLRLGLDDFETGRIGFSPFLAVTNILDRSYNSSVVVNAFGSRYFEPGPGRTFSVGLEMDLGR